MTRKKRRLEEKKRRIPLLEETLQLGKRETRQAKGEGCYATDRDQKEGTVLAGRGRREKSGCRGVQYPKPNSRSSGGKPDLDGQSEKKKKLRGTEKRQPFKHNGQRGLSQQGGERRVPRGIKGGKKKKKSCRVQGV